MNKLVAFAAVAFLSFTGVAHAALVDVSLGSTASSLSYSTGGTLVANTNLVTLGSALSNDGAVIINPAVSFAPLFQEPTGPLLGNNYLAVFGSSLATGSSIISVASGINTFGFTWGSIDAYNTLTLTDSRGVVYQITGSDLLAQISGSVAGTTQANVSFSDKFGTIVTAQLTSTQNSFEAGNFSEVSAVPLPASFPLFAAALVGLFFVAQRKSKKSL